MTLTLPILLIGSAVAAVAIFVVGFLVKGPITQSRGLLSTKIKPASKPEAQPPEIQPTGDAE